jgi:hypothetical protein
MDMVGHEDGTTEFGQVRMDHGKFRDRSYSM